jgi:hypothetical protein
MNIKMNKLTIIFLILMVAIPIFSFNVGATESTITNSFKITGQEYRSIVVRSDGVMFAVGYDTGSPAKIKIYKSIDDGATWSENASYSSQLSSTSALSCCIGVDNDDIIHFFYVRHSTTYRLTHYYLETTGSWVNDGDVFSDTQISFSSYSCDVCFDSENMYVVWAYVNSVGSKLKYRLYNFILSTWGSEETLKSGGTIKNPSIIKYNDDLYAFYQLGSNINYAKFHNSNSTWTYNHDLVSSITYKYERPKSLLYNSKLYVFYQGNSSTNDKYQILYKSLSVSTWSSQSVLYSDVLYDQREPTVSVNSNGNLNVVWSGKDTYSSTYYQLRQCVYSSGTWGDVAFVSSGATDKRYSHLCYQDYPTFTWLVSGVSIAYADDTNDDLEYIDSDSLIWYSDDEYQGDFEFDANNNIGTLNTGCTMNVGYKDVEFKYQVPTTINATGFDLLVSDQMHGYDPDLSNYDFYINGESMGNPTEWKEYSGNYVLRWTFASDKVITNSEILFELWHDELVGGTSAYWNIGVSCNYEDLDGDGIATMRYSNTYPNGAFDGTWLAKDVAYQLYFNTISFVEDETDVTYNSISAINTTYYVGESVSLTYTIKSSDLVYDNHVRIWNDDTATEITAGTMQGFPYLTQHQVETIGFVPFTSANYTAHLYINSVEVDNVSFFADDHINSDMHVFTYPNPSTVGQKIWVKYNFDHPSNKSGAIFLSLTPNLNSYISVNYLLDGDNGFWTCTHDTVGIYYYIMAVDINGNGTYGIVNNGVHAHYVRSEHGNNYFTLGGYNLRLNTEGIVTQIVNGECNMVSGNCYIYDNNQLVKTITGSPFSYNYEIHTAGLHTVEMRLITNVTTVLCTQNYSVSTYTGEEDIEQIEDSGYAIRDWIYNNSGDFGIFIAGVLIILGFMFIPFALVLYVNVTYNKNVSLGDIHWSIYLIFAIVGVIVVVQLHLADLWIILLICVVSIAITVISYNGRNG